MDILTAKIYLTECQDNRLRVSYGHSDRDKICLDGSTAKEGDMVVQKPCNPMNIGQEWDYDASETKHLMNRLTKLCLDPMRFDYHTYPQTKGKNDWPVSMQPCGKSEDQRLGISFIRYYYCNFAFLILLG